MARLAITGDARMGEVSGRIERTVIRMTNVTILDRWQMAYCLNSRRIARNKLAGMTAFAATSNTWVNRAYKC